MITRKNCPCCGNDNIEEKLSLKYDTDLFRDTIGFVRYHYDISNLYYTIHYCNRCSLYYQETVLDEEESRVLYSSDVGGSGERIRSLEEVAHLAEDAMLIRLLFPGKVPKVLDFGMNTGDWARVASAYGCECYGTDIADFSKMRAAEKAIKFVDLDQLQSEFFDFINADQVFEHLADPLDVLKRLHKALHHNGIIKISCPGDRHIDRKIKRLMNGKILPQNFLTEFDSIAPFLHINLFNAKSLVILGKSAGFERFRIPIRLSYSTMTLFNTLRQLNRNLWRPIKLYLARGTWQFFIKK